MIFIIIMMFVAGAGIFFVSLFLKNDKEKQNVENNEHSNEYLDNLIEERINLAEHRIGDVAEKTANYAQNQAKQELEKLSREKLSQVNEYSDQVMEQINKNHSEVMFLYGLLSDKQKELDETVESLNQAQKELQISQRISRQNSKKNQIPDEDKAVSENLEYRHKDNMSDEADNNKEISDMKPENPERNTEQPDDDYDKRALIKHLAGEGKTEIEIAKQLSMGVGEVRLVLELSKGV